MHFLHTSFKASRVLLETLLVKICIFFITCFELFLDSITSYNNNNKKRFKLVLWYWVFIGQDKDYPREFFSIINGVFHRLNVFDVFVLVSREGLQFSRFIKFFGFSRRVQFAFITRVHRFRRFLKFYRFTVFKKFIVLSYWIRIATNELGNVFRASELIPHGFSLAAQF